MRPAVVLFSKVPTSLEAKTWLAQDAGWDRAQSINTWLVKRSLDLPRKRSADLD